MVRRLWPPAAIIVGLLLVAVGGYNLLPKKPVSLPDNTTALPAPITIISPIPGATPAPDLPGTAWRVKVPEVGINLPIVAGDGITAPLYKAVEVPTLKLPGEGGRSMIYAHARAGMFAALANVRVGGHIEVDRPGLPALHYTIRTFNPRWPSKDLSILQPANHEELILLTCTTYNANDPRVVAVATPD